MAMELISETIEGAYINRQYYPDGDFWANWKTDKESLKSQGFRAFKNTKGFWVVSRMILAPFNDETLEKGNYKLPGYLWLKGFQRDHADLIYTALRNHNSAVDGSDTGIGKTYVALAVAVALKQPIAVICTKSGIDVWKKLCKQFGVPIVFIGNYEAFKFNSTQYGYLDKRYYPKLIAEFLGIPCTAGNSYGCNTVKQALRYLRVPDKNIIGWEREKDKKFPWDKCARIKYFHWRVPENTFFIFDEVHKCKAEWSINSKMLIASKPFTTLILSATIAHTPRQLKASGYILGLHRLVDFNEWSMKYGCYKNRYKQWTNDSADESMKKISKDIFPDHGSRLRAEHVKEFPDNFVRAQLITVPDPKAYNDKFKAMMEQYSKAVDEGERAKALTIRLHYRMWAEAAKVPMVLGIINEYLEKDCSVAVFVNFTETRLLFERSMKSKCSIYGQQKESERNHAIAGFQADKSRVIVCNIQAGGQSISLHDTHGRYRRVSLVFPSYSGFDMKQVLGRLPRIGAKSKVIQSILYAADTIEEEVCEKVNAKLDSLSALMDGDLMEKDLLQLGEEKDA